MDISLMANNCEFEAVKQGSGRDAIVDVVIMIAVFNNQLQASGYAEATVRNYSYYLGFFQEYLDQLGISDIRKVTNQIIQDYQEAIRAKKLAMETQGLFIRPVKRFCISSRFTQASHRPD